MRHCIAFVFALSTAGCVDAVPTPRFVAARAVELNACTHNYRLDGPMVHIASPGREDVVLVDACRDIDGAILGTVDRDVARVEGLTVRRWSSGPSHSSGQSLEDATRSKPYYHVREIEGGTHDYGVLAVNVERYGGVVTRELPAPENPAHEDKPRRGEDTPIYIIGGIAAALVIGLLVGGVTYALPH
jgi:hypothetical protein